MKKYAILTNDLQYAAMNKHEERMQAVKSFLPGQIDLLKKMRDLGIPIIHLQLVKKEEEKNWHDRLFIRGSEGGKIIKEVLEPEDIIVEKYKDSGFFETELEQKLKELGITSVIITGMQTQICVQTTAADAYFRGYEVFVPSDVVVSTQKLDTERALIWLEKYCAKVMTSEELITFIKLEKE